MTLPTDPDELAAHFARLGWRIVCDASAPASEIFTGSIDTVIRDLLRAHLATAPLPADTEPARAAS